MLVFCRPLYCSHHVIVLAHMGSVQDAALTLGAICKNVTIFHETIITSLMEYHNKKRPFGGGGWWGGG